MNEVEPEKSREISPEQAAKLFGPEGGGRRFLELVSQLNNLDEIIIESAPHQTGIVGRIAGLVTFTPERFVYLAGKFPKSQGSREELIDQLKVAIEGLPETEFSIESVKGYVDRLRKWEELEHTQVAIGLLLGSSKPSRQPVSVLYKAPVLAQEEAIDLLKKLALKDKE